jgi:hypothetical protein
MLKNNTISCNNETFIDSSYNELSILRHEEDGYVNASQLCRQEGKRIKDFFKSRKYEEIFVEFNSINGVQMHLHVFMNFHKVFCPNCKVITTYGGASPQGLVHSSKACPFRC